MLDLADTREIPGSNLFRSGDFLFPDKTQQGEIHGYNGKNTLQDDDLSDKGLGYLSVDNSRDYLNLEIAAVALLLRDEMTEC